MAKEMLILVRRVFVILYNMSKSDNINNINLKAVKNYVELLW